MSASRFTRRRLLEIRPRRRTAAALVSMQEHADSSPRRLPGIHIAPGPFQPTWESLKAGYKAPDWFRDAKFGIWNHWTAQCVPEQGDWYARRMYLQGDKRLRPPPEDLRPSLQGRLDGDRQPVEGGELGARRADEPLRRGRRQVLHRARQPSRQLRQLRLALPQLELGEHRAEEGHRRHLCASWRAQHGLRFAVTNHSSHAWHWLQVRLRVRSRRPAWPASATTPTI